MRNTQITPFFDQATNTVSYIVADDNHKVCAIIDSVLDYDPASSQTSTLSADLLIKHIKDNELTLVWILETHVHADHLSAAPYLQDALGGKIAIGKEITQVQSIFADLLNLKNTCAIDGSQFDILLDEGDELPLGDSCIKVMHTPGHTPACISYYVDDACFVGDTLFMPDYGTARCDFPGGDANTLYHSIQKILSLPDETQIYTCHDYKAENRDHYAWQSSVSEQKQFNLHINQTISETDFTQMRSTKDATLTMPKLIWPAVQINMRAGKLPSAEDNGTMFLKIPVSHAPRKH
jgi:glyoxylase-like metal-dependent hydrolase (beta-lactamase superfamily II)